MVEVATDGRQQTGQHRRHYRSTFFRRWHWFCVLCFTDQYFDLCLIPPGAAQLPPPQKANQEACSPSCLLTRRGQFGRTSGCDGHTTDKDRQTSCSCRHTRHSAKPSNKTWLQKPRPALWEIQSLFWLKPISQLHIAYDKSWHFCGPAALNIQYFLFPMPSFHCDMLTFSNYDTHSHTCCLSSPIGLSDEQLQQGGWDLHLCRGSLQQVGRAHNAAAGEPG